MKQSMSCLVLVLASVGMILLEEQRVASMAVAVSDMAQQCDPDVLQQVDSPKIRRICNFLQNYAVAMQQLNREGTGGGLYPDGMMENGVKRQDVDHVFLRFGRRRR